MVLSCQGKHSKEHAVQKAVWREEKAGNHCHIHRQARLQGCTLQYFIRLPCGKQCAYVQAETGLKPHARFAMLGSKC